MASQGGGTAQPKTPEVLLVDPHLENALQMQAVMMQLGGQSQSSQGPSIQLCSQILPRIANLEALCGDTQD